MKAVARILGEMDDEAWEALALAVANKLSWEVELGAGSREGPCYLQVRSPSWTIDPRLQFRVELEVGKEYDEDDIVALVIEGFKEAVRQLSRLKFGRDKDLVEEEIRSRLQQDYEEM